MYTQVIILLYTILNHIDSKTSLPNCEDSYMIYRHKWYRKLPLNTQTLMIYKKNTMYNLIEPTLIMFMKKGQYQSNIGWNIGHHIEAT